MATWVILKKIVKCANQVLKQFPEDVQAKGWLAKVKKPLLSVEIQKLEDLWEESAQSKVIMTQAFQAFQKIDQAIELQAEDREELQQKPLS